MSLDENTNEAHERRIVRCKSCRARIIFLPTPAGKNMPCDADTVEPSDDEFEYGRHVPHFTVCPDANKFRKPR